MIRVGLVLQLVLTGAYFVCVRPIQAQSQDAINAVTLQQVGDARRRIEDLERQSIAPRLAVLEENMFEVKWLGRTVAAAVIGQLVLAGLSASGKRRQG